MMNSLPYNIEEFDRLIDTGKEDDVYKLLRCRNPAHEPDSEKCDGCKLLETEMMSSDVTVGRIKKNPYLIVDEGEPSVGANKMKVPCHISIDVCALKDYIDMRENIKRAAKDAGMK
jgi:hypothetical protein